MHAGVGETGSPLDENGVLDIDTTISLETTWHAMEDLVSKGLVRSIGIRCQVFVLTIEYFLVNLLNLELHLIENLFAATMTSF